MRTLLKPVTMLMVALSALMSCASSDAGCPPAAGVALQILGSGGPIADDGRASSGYVVWVDGRSRALIDAGGGTFLRFGETGASFADLDFVGLSHLHADHSADFPALLKSGNFSGRKRALVVAGPDGDGPFPGLESWLQSLLDADSGAFAYLSGFLDGTAGLPMLVRKELIGDVSAVVYRDDDIVVDAMHVPHGIVPAVAFRLRSGDVTIVFATDQNGGNAKFVEFARDASILVMHMVVPEDISGAARRLHAPPSVIGTIAGEAGPGKLVLSHFMARSLAALDENTAHVQAGYKGDIVLAEDLACIAP